jgi:hypothetical protein
MPQGVLQAADRALADLLAHCHSFADVSELATALGPRCGALLLWHTAVAHWDVVTWRLVC